MAALVGAEVPLLAVDAAAVVRIVFLMVRDGEVVVAAVFAGAVEKAVVVAVADCVPR